MNSNTYVLRTDVSKNVWLVDCGDVSPIFELFSREDSVVGVLLTHGHSDHIYGLNEMITVFPDVKIFTTEFGVKQLQSAKLNFSRYHEEYEAVVIDKVENVVIMNEGDIINVCGHQCRVYATPGHDPSCLCYEIDGFIFTGDAYIPDVPVFTGFPKSDKGLAEMSQKRILALSKNLTVCPGHGDILRI